MSGRPGRVGIVSGAWLQKGQKKARGITKTAGITFEDMTRVQEEVDVNFIKEKLFRLKNVLRLCVWVTAVSVEQTASRKANVKVARD